MRKCVRVVMPILAASGILLTGCGKTTVASLPYDLTKSVYEVYQEGVAASEYVNTRASGTQQYEYRPVVNEQDKQKLIGMVDRIENAFTGAPNTMTELLIDDATYENVKYMLDKYTLTRDSVVQVQQASNLYVVDVNYKGTRASQIQIPAGADMVGLEGFYTQPYANKTTWEADDKFGVIVTAGMNDFCVKNAVMYQFAYSLEDHRILMEPGTPTAITIVFGADTTTGAGVLQELEDSGFDPTQFIHGGEDSKRFDYTDCDLNGNDMKDIDELRDYCAAWEIAVGEVTGAQAAFDYPDADGDLHVTEEEMQAVMDEIKEKGYPEEYELVYAKPEVREMGYEEDLAGIDVSYDEYVDWVATLTADGIASKVGLALPVESDLIPEEERITFPVLAVNTIVGAMSTGYASANTDIFESLVDYQLGGRGFFGNAGSTGLNVFDEGFAGTSAEISIRYYIKEEADGLRLVSILPTLVESSYDAKKWRDADPLLLTEEIKNQAQEVLYGLDRVICNEDLAGVAGGDLVLNKAYAGLMCYGRIGTVISDYNTTLDGILAYNEAQQLYLCRCKRQYAIGGMNTGCTGKYKETVYVAMQMTEDGMRIVDEMPVKAEMVSEPFIEPTPLAEMVESSLPKYTETVPNEIQDAVKAVLEDYYKGCNARVLSITDDAMREKFGTNIGIQDVYVVAPNIFSQDEADLYIARMKNYLSINGRSTVAYSNMEFQGSTPVLTDVVLTETFTFNSAAEPVVEKIHYTFVQDNGRWRICGAEVLETNQTVFENSDIKNTTQQAPAQQAPADGSTQQAPAGDGTGAPAGDGTEAPAQ